MSLVLEVEEVTRKFANCEIPQLANLLADSLKKMVGSRCGVSANAWVGENKNDAIRFSTVIYGQREPLLDFTHDLIPTGAVAIMIDAMDNIDIDALNNAYARISAAKKLHSTLPETDEVFSKSHATMGVILARTTNVPLDHLMERVRLLNQLTQSRDWPDVIVITSVGTIQYGVQFLNKASIEGPFLPPAHDAFVNHVPPLYIQLYARPSPADAFAQMISTILAGLQFFLPGRNFPNHKLIDAGNDRVLTRCGYMFNRQGHLIEAPPEFYAERVMPSPALRIESAIGEILANVQFVPWIDGGVIMIRGKVPLGGLLMFAPIDIAKIGGLKLDRDLEVSNVLPITLEDFHEMLRRFQNQSNMLVKRDVGKWIFQTVSKEGTSLPFNARLLLGILRLREVVFEGASERAEFTKLYEVVSNALVEARAQLKLLQQVWSTHEDNVGSGEIAKISAGNIHISNSIDRELSGHFESFMMASNRACKTGLQNLALFTNVDFRFLFKKTAAFQRAIEQLRISAPSLAQYLTQARLTIQVLTNVRNDIEHSGWKLPAVRYARDGARINCFEPVVLNQPVLHFAGETFDKICCLVEELVIHCMQQKLRQDFAITEIPLPSRDIAAPERFRITLSSGGLPCWEIRPRGEAFEER